MMKLKKVKTSYFVIMCVLLLAFTICYAEVDDSPLVHMPKKREVSFKNKVAYIKDDNIWFFDPTTGQSVQLTQTGDIANFSISQDHEKMVVVKNEKLYLINATTGEENFLTDVETDMSNPSISPTNEKVVYINESEKKFRRTQYATSKVRHIWLIDVKTRVKVDLTKDSLYHHTAVQWSPDGRWIAFASSRGKGWRVYLMDMIDKKQSVKEIESGIFSAWLDNKALAIGNSHSIKIYNVQSLKGFQEIKMQPGFSPAKFTFAGDNNLYYEDMSENPDLDISHLDLVSGKVSRVIEDGRSPVFAK